MRGARNIGSLPGAQPVSPQHFLFAFGATFPLPLKPAGTVSHLSRTKWCKYLPQQTEHTGLLRKRQGDRCCCNQCATLAWREGALLKAIKPALGVIVDCFCTNKVAAAGRLTLGRRKLEPEVDAAKTVRSHPPTAAARRGECTASPGTGSADAWERTHPRHCIVCFAGRVSYM